MAVRIYYNPLDVACKNRTGAVARGEELQFNVYALRNESSFQENSIVEQQIAESDCRQPEEWQKGFLQIQKDGEEVQTFPMSAALFGWHISLKIHEIGLYSYCFYIEGIGFVACSSSLLGVLSEKREDFLLTVYDESYRTPDWFKGGVMYQIFSDRFCKQGTMPDITGRIARQWGDEPYYLPNERGKILNNDFFGGNLRGIESKLPYLEQLGVTTVYLNPIFRAASNHRYDTSDYLQIDPILGTNEDFRSLVLHAESHDMRIILDGVFNHTGDDSVYFNKYGHYDSLGAYQSKDSPYYSWYLFEEYPEKYECWWGIDILPEINEYSESYQNFILGEDGVLKHWLAYGIGGYRLDVADELPDFFLKKLRKTVKEFDKDGLIIGEVWEDASNKVAYSKRREYLQGLELDSVMNYPLKDAIIRYMQNGDAAELACCIRTISDHYPKQTIDCLMNILGTHDTYRILTVLGGISCNSKAEMSSEKAFLTPEEREKAMEKLKMAAVLQYTLPGVPCLYYGDERGMEGHSDPFCRRCFDWNKPQDELLDFYCRLGAIRRSYRSVWKDGKLKILHVQDGLLLYKRANDYGSIYVYVNHSPKNYALRLPIGCRDLLTETDLDKQMEIAPFSYGIFYRS